MTATTARCSDGGTRSMAEAATQDSGLRTQDSVRQPGRYVSGRRRALRTFARNRTAVVGLGLVAAIVLLALTAPIFFPHDPLALSVRDKLQPPSWEHPLGTDDKGRDVLDRVIHGTRVAL